MTRRKLLASVVALMFFVGLSLFFYPFVVSMSPSAKAVASVPSLALSEVPVDTLTEFNDGDVSRFFYRSKEDRFLIFDAYKNSWGYFIWRDGGRAECHEIRLEGDAILCFMYNQVHIRWTLSGQPDSWWAPDIDMVPYKVSGNRVRYGPGA